MLAEIPLKIQHQKKSSHFFEEIYEKVFFRVAQMVSQSGGSFEEAKDIFHDALLIYYEKMQTNSINIHSSEEAYVLGISKHLWRRKFQKNHNLLSLTAEEKDIQISEEETPKPDQQGLLKFLEQSGKKCLEILSAFYYRQLSMQDIAKVFGYKSTRSATVQKYKCLEKLRNTVKEKQIPYESFLK